MKAKDEKQAKYNDLVEWTKSQYENVFLIAS